MILLDTSVVMDELRRPSAAVRRLFIENNAAICGVTRAEVLQGGQSARHFSDLIAVLDHFPELPIRAEHWDALGQNLARLRQAGRKVPFQDALIATIAIENDVELWTRDTHFHTIQQIIPELKLFAEPVASE